MCLKDKEKNIRIVLTQVENGTMSKDDAISLILALTDGDKNANGSCEIHQNSCPDEIIRITDAPCYDHEIEILNKK